MARSRVIGRYCEVYRALGQLFQLFSVLYFDERFLAKAFCRKFLAGPTLF